MSDLSPMKKYRVADRPKFPITSKSWLITEIKTDKDGKHTDDNKAAVGVLTLTPGAVIELSDHHYHRLFQQESGPLYPMWLLTRVPDAAPAQDPPKGTKPEPGAAEKEAADRATAASAAADAKVAEEKAAADAKAKGKDWK